MEYGRRAKSGTTWANELHVPPSLTAAAQAREFVRGYCESQELPYLAENVELVVSELVTNAVVHAQTRIRVRIEELPFCVRLTVYDEAVDLPLLSLASRVSALEEGGRGVWIVDACSVEWGTDLHALEGKSTWALFAVRPGSFAPESSRLGVS